MEEKEGDFHLAQGVALLKELACVAFVESTGEEQDNVVDHVTIGDVVEELRGGGV